MKTTHVPCSRLAIACCSLLVAAGAHGQAVQPQAEFLNINPSWSPDGTRIAFESRRDGVVAIYVIDVDGTGERRLTTDSTNNTHPDWSPDGRFIVYDSFRDGVWNLYTIRPDGTDERRLAHPGADTARAFARHPAVSPDGKWIAFDSSRDGDGEIYVMRSDGGAVRRITATPESESHPRWTRDGRVTFDSAVPDQQRTWSAHPESGEIEPLFGESSPHRSGEVSPDGRHVLFSSSEGPTPRLFVAPIDGSAPPWAITAAGRTSYEWAWSPDGRRIAFYFDRDGRHELYLIDADGKNLRQLTGSQVPPGPSNAGAPHTATTRPE